MSRVSAPWVLGCVVCGALALALPSLSGAQAPPATGYPTAYPPYPPAPPSAYPRGYPPPQPTGAAPAPAYPPGTYPAPPPTSTAPAPAYPPGTYPAPPPGYPPGTYPAPAPTGSAPPGYPPGTYPAPAPPGHMPTARPPSWEWQPPPYQPGVGPQAPPEAAGEAKSAGLAGFLSVASTMVPVLTGFFMMALRDTSDQDHEDFLWAGLIVMNTGVSVGPSIGHMYVGELGRGFGMAGLRLVGAWGSTGLLAGAVANLDDDYNLSAAGVMFVSGAVVGVATMGLMLWDMVDAPGAAERTNRQRQLEADRRAWLPRVQAGPAAARLEWAF